MKTRSMRREHTQPTQVVRDFEQREEDRRNREVRMIHRRLGTDIRFRSTEDINSMLATGRLGDKPAKFFIVSAHGRMSRKRVFRMPPRMAVFDLAENEYRGLSVCECLEQPLLNTMIGRKGTHIGSFFNAMLGGEYTPNPTSPLIPQIAYRAPGELVFNSNLGIEEDDEPDNYHNSLGCWDITDAISTFNPMDFTRWCEGCFIAPNESRTIETPQAPPYKPDVEIMNRMKSKEGIYLNEVIQIIENKYPTSACFIIVLCCMGLGSPERLGTEYPEQPSAYTHYALKGEPIGNPAVDLVQSMACRDMDEDVIEYEDNPSLSMVLRSRSVIKCTISANNKVFSPYRPIFIPYNSI